MYLLKKKGSGITWSPALLVLISTSIVATPVGECPSYNPGYATFLRDSVECSVFYFCSWGEPVKFSCPNGLLFNFERNSCDWPEDTDCNVATEEVPACDGCSRANCPVINDVYVTFFPHDTDCTKYCKCDWGVAYEMPCPVGLHWNTNLDVCDWPHSAGCTLGESGGCNSATEDTPTDNSSTEDTPTDNSSTEDTPTDNSSTEDTSTDGNNNSTDIPPVTSEGCENVICPEHNEGNVTFFPHENSCEQYCVCNWGSAISMSCPPGLHFNTDLEVCDNAEDANCDVSEWVTTETPTGSTDETPNMSTEAPTDSSTEAETDKPAEETTDTSTEIVTDQSIEEPAEETTDISTEVPDDLTTEAETEEPIDETVSTSTAFPTEPPNELETEEPTEVPDEQSTEAELTTVESTELSTTEASATSTEVSFITTESTEPTDNVTGFDGCSDIVCMATTQTVLYPHKTVCDKYCFCSFGIVMEMPCINGFHFNRALSICDYPSSAKCLEDGTTESSENSTEKPVESDGCSYASCTVENGTEFYPHETDCEKYCICSNGITIEVSCSSDYLYNRDLKMCDYAENVKCDVIETTETPEDGCSYATCTPANGTIFFAHKSDCKLYCICTLGMTVEVACPEGYFFNDKLGICDSSENSDCIADNSDVTTIAPVIPPSNGCSHAVCTRTDAPVFFAHATDCNKYCVCNFAFAVEMSCPNGLHFNTELDICDYPQHVNCNENVDQSTSAPPEGPVNSVSCAHQVCTQDDSALFYPHETDCSKYCICNLGITIEMACPTGSYFSKDFNTCNNDEGEDCVQNEDATYPPVEFVGCLSVTCPEINDDNVTFFPHDFDCEKYCVCNWGYPIEMPCPAGLYFNTELNVCDIPENSGCYNEEVTSTEAENETTTTEQEEENNTTESEDVVSTTENTEETSSEGEENGYSTSTTEAVTTTTEPAISTTEPAISTTEPTVSTTESAVSTTDPVVSTTDPAVSTTEPVVPIIGCDSTLCPLVNDVYVTFLAHKLDCGKYCVCDWGRAIEMSCPSGLHFNLNYNVCDYPSSAKCTI